MAEEEKRALEDFTDEEIAELEASEARGDKVLTVDDMVNLIAFDEEDLAEIKSVADEVYAEVEAEYDAKHGIKPQ